MPKYPRGRLRKPRPGSRIRRGFASSGGARDRQGRQAALAQARRLRRGDQQYRTDRLIERQGKLMWIDSERAADPFLPKDLGSSTGDVVKRRKR